MGSARALRHSSQRVQAAALVDQAVEQVRSNGFGQLTLGVQPLSPVTQDCVTYEGEREILDLPDGRRITLAKERPLDRTRPSRICCGVQVRVAAPGAGSRDVPGAGTDGDKERLAQPGRSQSW